MANKQWRVVEEATQNPEDDLIIGDYPYNDERMSILGNLSPSVTVVHRQQDPKGVDKTSSTA